MPAIPIHTASPINPTKASDVTPQTAVPDAAQPGAQPSLPVPTGTSWAPSNPQPVPTPTAAYVSPPAPQPGAFPTPPSRVTELPPPKVGETLQTEQPQATLVPRSPQMAAYAPLGAPEVPATRPSATIPIPSPFLDPLGGRSGGGDLLHPPGYYQNVNASEFNSSQRAAHDAAVARDEAQRMSISHRMALAVDAGDDEGVWGTAKKWASVAGGGLAAAEQEVWKRINKD
ncbi:hypothetical protein G7Z17_g9865 [Cylindrodendrum hubeiense]|uniref:Uncharacterized protein n=1 Tax=Cylindrodendrum hubeiense TaxID=595255 RepID=A0A9P5H360_9HYPO|nr:hypothetical protein G7Z17_g9865 [Cylindrodendrum hubeiense]